MDLKQILMVSLKNKMKLHENLEFSEHFSFALENQRF